VLQSKKAVDLVRRGDTAGATGTAGFGTISTAD
jgi:hypothetical protein